MIVVDYIRRIDPGALRSAGVLGVCRYLSYSTPLNKVITLKEYNELIAYQILVTLNWEYASDDWLTGQGNSHASEAVRQAKALGYPAGSVIVGSADFDMTHSQWVGAGQQYARDFAERIRIGGYRPAVYGPWDVLQWVADAGYMDAFWQAGMSTAWSNGRNARLWPGAQLRQRAHMTIAGQDVDYSDVLAIPLWEKGNVPMKDAVIYRNPTTQACTLRAGMFFYHIPNPEALREIQVLISLAGGDGSVRNVSDAAAWDGLHKSGIDIAALAVAGTGTQVVLSQDQVNAAIAANVPALAAALAKHFSVS